MTIKRISFTPDATLRAAEAGHTITHIPMLCSVVQAPTAAKDVLVQFAMPAAYWDIAVNLLRRSQDLHGEALAEAFTNAIVELAKHAEGDAA